MTAVPRVGVVGASARALVHSLARAGREAWAIDLFADRDLSRVAPCAACPFDRYPDALPALAARFPRGPLLYTGGLENHPRVVAELAAMHELWGNPPEVLTRVRDPFHLSAVLGRVGPEVPRIAPATESAPATGRWLRKPRRSAGGTGIRFAHPGEGPSRSHYFQEFIDGVPMSAVYLNDTRFGITEQLVGEPWLHAKPFAYCGNVSPIALPDPVADSRHSPGELRGVWGLDFVLRDGTPYAVEVNPRYTASVEVIEHASGIGVFQNTTTQPPPSGGRQPPVGISQKVARRADAPRSEARDGGLGSSIIGKAIYYAPHRITFPSSGPWDADLAGDFDPWRLPTFADIPHPDVVIEPGWPVLTFFASGSSPVECRARLQSRAAELDTLFAEGVP